MKKYVKSSEYISKQDIHKAAVDIVSEELNRVYDKWVDQKDTSGWGVFKKLGLPEDEAGDTSYYNLCKNSNNMGVLSDLDDEIFDIIGDFVNSLK